MKDTILYIDDESLNLETFEIIFHEYYYVLTANDTDEAESLLKENDVKLILTDQRMPKEKGVDFVKRIQPQYPDLIFIVITGYTDADVILEALNTGVYQFIHKPWKEEELKQAISNAIEKHDLKKKNKELLLELLEKNKKLETSTEEFAKLAKKHRKDKRTIEESKNIFEAVFKKLPLMFFLLDEKGKIIKVNKSILEITNNKIEDIIGSKIGEVFNCSQLNENKKHGKSETCYSCFLNNTVKNSFEYKTDYHKIKATIPINGESNEVKEVIVSTSYIEGLNPMVLVSLDDLKNSNEITGLK